MRAYKKTNSLPCWSSITSCSIITPKVASFLMAFTCCSSIHSLATACWQSHGWSSTTGWLCLKAYSSEGNLASLAESSMSPCIDYGLYCSFSWVHLLLSTFILQSNDHLFEDSLYCLLLFFDMCYLFVACSQWWVQKALMSLSLVNWAFYFRTFSLMRHLSFRWYSYEVWPKSYLISSQVSILLLNF